MHSAAFLCCNSMSSSQLTTLFHLPAVGKLFGDAHANVGPSPKLWLKGKKKINKQDGPHLFFPIQMPFFICIMRTSYMVEISWRKGLSPFAFLLISSSSRWPIFMASISNRDAENTKYQSATWSCWPISSQRWNVSVFFFFFRKFYWKLPKAKQQQKKKNIFD